MAVITISRGCFSHGKEIAEKVAEALGYECVSKEILLEASEFFAVREGKLEETIHDAPGILDRMTHTREKFLICIQAALLEHIKKDNVVYHGYAGHLLIPDVPHILKVRVIADIKERIVFLREKRNMSTDEASDFIEKEDKNRADWYHYIYKTDTIDPLSYDMILNVGKLGIEESCEIICREAKSDRYRRTPGSEKAIRDLALSSHVKAALQGITDAEVTANEGIVRIKVGGQRLRKSGAASRDLQMRVRERIREDLTREILEVVRDIPGVKDVILDIDSPYYS